MVPIVPFVFIATVYGLYRLRSFAQGKVMWRAAGYLLIPLSLVAFRIDDPFQEQPLLPSATQEISNAGIVSMALDSVPVDGSLVTTNDYASHLAQRNQLYIIGIPAQRVAPTDPDVIFLNLYDQQYITCDQIQVYISKLDLNDYGVLFRTGGLIVLGRDTGSNEQFRDFVLDWNNCAG